MRKFVHKDFWKNLDTSGDCWEWHLGRTHGGYGRLWRDGKQVYAHRVAYELARGPIPAGLFVCHRCDNPPCCNPDHLWLGTQADNVRDRDAKGRTGHVTPEQARKGHQNRKPSSPEVKAARTARLTAASKVFFSNPENRKRQSERLKEHWKDPAARKHTSKKLKAYWADKKSGKRS